MMRAAPATNDIPKGQRRRQNKNRRVELILVAAKALISEGRSTDFTMQGLAERAGLSLATTYNLIGTKASVLYVLLDRSLETLAAEQARVIAATPIAQVDAMACLAVRYFTSDPEYYRPLMRYLLGVPEPTKRPFFMARAMDYWRDAAACLRGHERDVGLASLDDVARAMHVSFAGALDLWVHAEFDNRQFERQVRQNLCFILLAAIAGFDADLKKLLRTTST